jgi:hypothetical protein
MGGIIEMSNTRQNALRSMSALPRAFPRSQPDRSEAALFILAGIIGDPDGGCIAQCAGLTMRHFKDPVHWRIFSAYRNLRNAQDPDRTWRDPRFIAAISGVPITTIFKIGERDRSAIQFSDALQQLKNVRTQ